MLDEELSFYRGPLMPEEVACLEAAEAGRLRYSTRRYGDVGWHYPWNGKRRMPAGSTARLGGLWFLEKGRRTRFWQYYKLTDRGMLRLQAERMGLGHVVNDT